MNATTPTTPNNAVHKNIYTALAAAQAEMEMVAKGAINPAFKGEGKPKGTPYADLADVVLAVKGPLNNHGIAFFHQFIPGDVHIMRTVLVHGESDSRIECDVPLIVAQNNMQGMKSATTYAKRIGLESVTGVAPDDDDGNAAAAAAPRNEPRKAPPPEQPSPQQVEAELRAKLLESVKFHDRPKYQTDLAALRKMNPEAAAEVDVKIGQLQQEPAA